MLTIQRVKELVDDPTMSDEDVEAIRDECIAFMELALEAWRMKKKSSNPK